MTDGQRCVPCTNTWVTVLGASDSRDSNGVLFRHGNDAFVRNGRGCSDRKPLWEMGCVYIYHINV